MPTDTRKAARAMDTGTQNVSAPATATPQAGSSQAPAIDPQVLTMISDKRDRLATAYDQVAASLRNAATACDEFARVLPKDVSMIPPPMQFMPPAVSGSSQLQTHIYQPQMGQQGILSPSRKIRKAVTRDPNAPKKPNTAYIIFSNEIRAEMKAQNPSANQKELVTLIGQRWKRLTAEEKKVYEARYGADKERYDEELRIYKQAHGNINSPPPSSSDDNTEHSMLANAQNMQFMTMMGSSVLASASMMPYQNEALLSLNPASHATMTSFAPVAPAAPPPLAAESGETTKRKADETQDNTGQSGSQQQFEGESNAKKRRNVQARGKKNEGETHSGSLTSETTAALDESPKRQRRTRSTATTPANGSNLSTTRKRRAKDEATAA